jgi:Rod binding domain-containing protein
MSPALPIDATSAVQTRPLQVPQVAKGAGDTALRKAAVDFEAVFLSEMMKPMFDSLKTDGLMGGGHGEEAFRAIMLQNYGKAVANAGGIGLAAPIYRTMLQMQEAKASHE